MQNNEALDAPQTHSASVSAGDVLLLIGVLLIAAFFFVIFKPLVLLWTGAMALALGYKMTFPSYKQPPSVATPAPKRVAASPI